MRLSTLSNSLTLLALSGLASCSSGGSSTSSASDTLRLDTLTAHYDKLSLATGEGQLSFDISYVYPENDEALRLAVTQSFFGEELTKHEPRALLTGLKEHFIDVASEDSDSLQRQNEERHWKLGLRFVDIQPKYCSVEVQLADEAKERDTRSLIAQASFDRNKRKHILEQDLFVDGYKEQLAQLIQAKLMRTYRVQTLEELVNEGFFSPQDIAPNEVFILTPYGLRYVYNTKEIAIASLGNISVDLPLEDLRPLLRPEAITRYFE